MRIVEYQRTVPSRVLSESCNLLEFLFSEANAGWQLQHGESFPHITCINEILLAGQGNDGWFVMEWVPFEIHQEEYQELFRAFADLQARGGKLK